MATVNIPLITETLSSYISISPVEVQAFLDRIEPITLPHRETLVKTGERHQSLFLVNSGVLMTYSIDPHGDFHVLQFPMPMWWTGDLNTFMHGSPSVYVTQAMEESLVLKLKKKDFDEMLGEMPVYERYFRMVFQNSLVTHQKRIIANISVPADERYESLIQQYPMLEQHVPLKYIASYLGITPEFLSKVRRIRAQGDR